MFQLEDDSQPTLLDLVTNADETGMSDLFTQDELVSVLTKILADFPEKERDVLCLYYGLGGNEPLTLTQLSVQFGNFSRRAATNKRKGSSSIKKSYSSQATPSV